MLFDKRRFLPHWFETGTPAFLVRTLLERRIRTSALDGMLGSSDLLSTFDVDDMATEALLFQTGYLTITGEEDLGGKILYRLGFPNREVRQSLNERLLRALTPDPSRRLRLPGDSSINTGMECGGNVKARATTRFLWWTLHLTRDAAEAALLPSRSRKPGTGYGRRLAISRLAQGTEGKVCQSAARSYRSSTQPRQRAAEPRGSVSAFRPARRSAAGLCRTSTRSFRRGPSRGRRRKPEFVGDDGGGGA